MTIRLLQNGSIKGTSIDPVLHARLEGEEKEFKDVYGVSAVEIQAPNLRPSD